MAATWVDDFECCVCYELTENFTPCGHPLCRVCLARLLDDDLVSSICPLCRSPLEDAHIAKPGASIADSVPSSREAEVVLNTNVLPLVFPRFRPNSTQSSLRRRLRAYHTSNALSLQSRRVLALPTLRSDVLEGGHVGRPAISNEQIRTMTAEELLAVCKGFVGANVLHSIQLNTVKLIVDRAGAICDDRPSNAHDTFYIYSTLCLLLDAKRVAIWDVGPTLRKLSDAMTVNVDDLMTASQNLKCKDLLPMVLQCASAFTDAHNYAYRTKLSANILQDVRVSIASVASQHVSRIPWGDFDLNWLLAEISPMLSNGGVELLFLRGAIKLAIGNVVNGLYKVRTWNDTAMIVGQLLKWHRIDASFCEDVIDRVGLRVAEVVERVPKIDLLVTLRQCFGLLLPWPAVTSVTTEALQTRIPGLLRDIAADGGLPCQWATWVSSLKICARTGLLSSAHVRDICYSLAPSLVRSRVYILTRSETEHLGSAIQKMTTVFVLGSEELSAAIERLTWRIMQHPTQVKFDNIKKVICIGD